MLYNVNYVEFLEVYLVILMHGHFYFILTKLVQIFMVSLIFPLCLKVPIWSVSTQNHHLTFYICQSYNKKISGDT